MYLQQYPSAYGWQELYLPFVHHRRVRWQSFLLPAALLYWEYLLPGRFKQTKAERDRHRFKVPGLRNIELTAPYFHDGSMATMDDAVRAMAKYQLGIDLPQPEVDKIIAFLRTLTGEYKGKLLTNKNMI